jgi:micrococcal nuclease
MKKTALIILTIMVLSVVSAGCTFQFGNTHTNVSSTGRFEKVLVHVTKVVDGDTAYVRFQNGTYEKVRFLGVDTPETEVSRNRPNEYDHITDLICLTEWGLKAKEFTKKAIEGKDVYLVFDPISPRRGYYGRLLAYIYLLNGTDFTEELVELGYARVYVEGTFVKKVEYLSVQREAVIHRRGLWSCMKASTTSNTGVVIVSVVYDAPGDDSKNLNGEYVVIENKGKKTVSLDGWVLEDSDGNSFTLRNITLKPGELVRIHSGKGMNTTTDVYLGFSTPIWDNDGDTAYLYDKNGNLVSEYSWI